MMLRVPLSEKEQIEQIISLPWAKYKLVWWVYDDLYADCNDSFSLLDEHDGFLK